MNSTTRDRRPTTVADYHRLAALGRQRGLRLFEPAPGHWFCTSASAPLALHTLTGFTCDCAGFAHHARCSHHSLLLAELGWLPDPEPPAAIAETVRCRTCLGDGYVKIMTGGHVSDWIPGSCHRCKTTGQVPVQLTAGVAA